MGLVDLVAPKETAAIMMSGRLLVKYIKGPSRRRYVVTRMGGDCSFSLLCKGTGPYGCVGVLALRLLGGSGCSLNNFCSSFGCVSVTVPSSLWPMMLMPRNESVLVSSVNS